MQIQILVLAAPHYRPVNPTSYLPQPWTGAGGQTTQDRSNGGNSHSLAALLKGSLHVPVSFCLVHILKTEMIYLLSL